MMLIISYIFIGIIWADMMSITRNFIKFKYKNQG